MADVETIRVKSNLPDNRMALFERHPDHPGGEIAVYGDGTFAVARTKEVEAHLRSGELVESDEAEAAPTGQPYTQPDPDAAPQAPTFRAGDGGDAQNAQAAKEAEQAEADRKGKK